MIWIQIALALLKFSNLILGRINRQEAINEGYRQAFAEESLSIAAKVQTRDQIRKRIDALSDADVDAELRDLEPK